MERMGSTLKKPYVFAAFVALMWALPGCIDNPLDLGGDPAGAIPSNMAPDPSYKPSIGDRAVLLGTGRDAPSDSAPVLKDMTAFDKYERALKASNSSELAEMEQEGLLLRTQNGTRVSILALRDRTHIGDRYAAEIRILEGPLKDRSAWTPATLVTRLIQIDAPPQ